MKSLKEALNEWVDQNPEVKDYINKTQSSGLVCPNCEEGPAKCTCDNGIKMKDS